MSHEIQVNHPYKAQNISRNERSQIEFNKIATFFSSNADNSLMRLDLDFDVPAFISRIESELRRLGWKKSALYEPCGLQDSTFSDWKSGRLIPRLRHVIKIAHELGVAPGWLAFGDVLTTMNAPEHEVVTLLRHSTPAQRGAVVALLKSFAGAQPTAEDVFEPLTVVRKIMEQLFELRSVYPVESLEYATLVDATRKLERQFFAKPTSAPARAAKPVVARVP